MDPSGAGTARRDVLRLWLPTAIYIILIVAMALRPSPLLLPIRHMDKYLHTAAYAVLAVLSYRAFVRSARSVGNIRPVLMTLLLGLAVGMTDEGVQALGRVRMADRYDILADLVGTAVGALTISQFPKLALGSGRRTERLR